MEEARELFLNDPNKMLREWADEWGVTHERVRQLRIESGVPSRSAYNENVADAIIEIIQSGRGGLTTNRTYEGQPIGYEKFKTWMDEEEGLEERVLEAKKIAAKNLIDPIEKQCKYCREWFEIDNFKRTQKYQDGYTKFCKDCLDLLKKKKEDSGEEKIKHCISCKEDKKISEFSKSPNAPDGLKLICKDCHLKYKRKQRRKNAKI